MNRLLERRQTDLADGTCCTPFFEYTGPENHIVTRYRTPELTLLAARRITARQY
ncbi:MAG: hypothetical protein OXG35_22650 [Acidobacteria bacterium]|nr:hypothetical protein [Acidobacteriota bacterium]